MNHEYFMDQYGYLYRWEETPEGKKSVVVANWQGDNKGSAKEVGKLLGVLDSRDELLAALEEIVELCQQHGAKFSLQSPRAAIAKAKGEA